METLTKALHSRRGAVLMYVVMAITVVAAIAISVTLVATNLYSRTAVKASDEQAYLLAKSIAQCFVADDTYSVNGIVDYLEKNPTGKVTAKATVYFDPATMATSSNVNTKYLSALSVTDATISFYLDKDTKCLYGDVTVNYNGATSTATLVMTGNNPGSYERNMADLFDNYDVYATQPNGQHLNMSGGTGTVKPSYGLYNDKSTVASVSLDADIDGNIKANGDFQLQSNNATDRVLSGGIQAYGDLYLYRHLTLTSGDVLVNGKLVVGESSSKETTVTIANNVYCFSDVTVYAKSGQSAQIVSGSIYSEGNVVVQNAKVSNIYATSGSVTINGATVDNISTQGAVTLRNCTVNGTVHAGSLTIYDSTVKGNITVEGSAVVSGGSILPNGNLTIISQAGDTTIGTGTGNSIYCSGNLLIRRTKSAYSLTVNGTVEVAGGLSDPVASDYPFVSTINGNLVVHGGIKSAVYAGSPVRTEYYNLAYLIGLCVKSVGGGTGNVVLDWAVPMFRTNPQYVYQSSEGSNGTIYASLLDADKRTEIQNTLFVCTNGSKSDGLAGNFSLFNHYGARADKRADVYSDICLNGAVLNHVMVGSSTTYGSTNGLGDIAVWGGTIKGNVLAHDILLGSVYTASSSQCFYARTRSGSVGNITLGAITGSTINRNTASDVINSASTFDLNPTSTLNYYGVLDATGEVNVANGVVLAATSDVSCRMNATINGVVKGRFVVGNKVSANSEVLIGYRTSLQGADDGQHVFYVNGSLRVPYDMPAAGPYSAVAYVTGQVILTAYNAPFAKIYEYTKHTEARGAQYAICHYAGGGSALEERTLLKNYTVLYDATAAGKTYSDTSQIQYIERGSLAGGLSLVNNENNTHITYVSCDCTVVGNFITAGYIAINKNANLTVSGDLHCRGVFSVDDGAYIASPSALSSVCRDLDGVAVRLSSVSVSGEFVCSAERADVTIADSCAISGNVILSTMGEVTVEDSSLLGSLSAINAALKITHNSVVGNNDLCSVIAKTVRLEDSLVRAKIYVNGSTVQVIGSSFGSISAPNARVDLRDSSSNQSDGSALISAKQLIGESDATVKGSVFLTGDAESEFRYVSSTGTIYSANGDVRFLTGSNITQAALQYSGAVTFTFNSLAQTAKLLTDDELNAMNAEIAAFGVYPAIVPSSSGGTVYDDMLSYDEMARANFAYYPTEGVSSKVSITPVANKPQLSLTNETYWSTQSLPLKWVFPDGTNTAATVEGERVQLNSSSATSSMSVAYKSLNLWDSAQAYLDGIWNAIKSAVEDNFELAHPLKSVKNAFLAAIENVKNAIVSASTVGYFAGIADTPDSYYRYTATNYSSKVKTARTLSNGALADLLITSVCYLSGDSTMYSNIRNWSVLGINIGKLITDWLDDDLPTIAQILKNIPWGNPKYTYRPCGMFFFNSGFVPAEAFNAYYTKDHSTYAKPSSDKYRSSYNLTKDRDGEGRWYWGGEGVTGSGSVADCTWTFFTCTDPANPYTSAAKDLHIVLPKHTYFAWTADRSNCVHIIGNGRVFLYLQEDTNIKLVANEWGATNYHQVFGGYRYVQTSGDKTVYYTSLTTKNSTTLYDPNDKTKRPRSVYLDYPYATARSLQPRMFIVGTGPHITFEAQDFNMAAYVYMPNGQNYTSSDWSGTEKNNKFIISNTSTASNITSDVYGMYVADTLITQGKGNPNYKTRFYRTAVDLSDTTIYYNANLVTAKRADGRYRLAEFWDYPDNMPLGGMPFYYKGLALH